MKIQASFKPCVTLAVRVAVLLLVVLLPMEAALAQETGTNPGGGTEAVPPATITVDNNQIVPLNGSHKWVKPTLCHIKLSSPQSNDVTAVLVNPAISATNSGHRLSFNAVSPGETLNSDGTLTVTLPKDGATAVDFSINGANGSQAMSDAAIEAHHDTATGDVMATGSATVYWLHSKHMSVSTGSGVYSITTALGQSILGTPSQQDVAVHMIGQLVLEPLGVDVPDIQVSVAQNAVKPNAFTSIWDTPTWPSPIAGDTVTIPSQHQVANQLSATADDVVNTAPGPVYNDYVSLRNGFLNTDDRPNFPTPQRKTVDVLTNKGVKTQVAYTRLISQTMDCDFLDWCVLYNTALPKTDPQQIIQALLQSSWSLHVGTGRASNTAVPGAADQPVSSGGLVLTTDYYQYANQLAKDHPSDSGPLVTLP